MNIYIEFFSALPQKNGVRYHGGGYYTRSVIKQLLKQKRENVNIILLCPSLFEVSQDNEPELYKENISWMKVDEICEKIKFKENSILYYPMLGYLRDLCAIAKIRKCNPNLKICATLHDVRFLEYTVDYTEKYYKKGLERLFFPIYSYLIDNLLKKIIKRPALRKCLRALSEVYTVSNYSMQQILKIDKNAHIALYYQSFVPNKEFEVCKNLPLEYVLFVSGARPIKNLSHALLAFSKYKEHHAESDLKLVITGVDKETVKNLCQMPKLNREVVERDTVLLGYVSKEELSYLYRKCRFVLYVSKNEGFGLPVLEAAAYGKTCISSNVSSIPEVIGSAVIYVSPTDDSAIADAINYLCDDEKLGLYEERVLKAFDIVKRRMQLEQENFILDMLSTSDDGQHKVK